jgi:hypothetical protein
VSGITEFTDVLDRYAKARIPFVTIRSSERKRVEEALRGVYGKNQLTATVHTITQGLRDLASDQSVSEETSIYAALEHVAQQIQIRDNTTFVFTDVQDLGTDSPTARQFHDIANLAERRGGQIVVLTNDPVWPTLQRLGMSVELSTPDRDEMAVVVQEFFAEYRSVVEWGEVEFRQAGTILSGITRLEAENALATLLVSGKVTNGDIGELSKIKDRIFSDLSGIERVNVPHDLPIAGLEGLTTWLDRQRRFLTEDLRARGLKPPRGVLLVGVPGCGKSLSAKAVASSWDLPLYRLDLAAVLGQYVGQSENQLRQALETVDHIAPCVLWIDEIEKGLAGAGSDSTGVTTRMVGQFLYWLQESEAPVFVVATANEVQRLPAELLRKGRFDEMFFVDLPNDDERRSILSLYLNRYLNREISEDLLNRLVQQAEGFSGADIEASLREVGREADLIGDENVTDEFIVSLVDNTVPFSKSSPERVDQIRAWGRDRAVPASGRPHEEVPGGRQRRLVVGLERS